MRKTKKENSTVSYKTQKNTLKINKTDTSYTTQDALKEFDELKNIALSCFDKNGNPNINAAMRAVENKAKICGLYTQNNVEIGTVVKMGEITIDGEQLKLDIGEEFYK